MAKPASLPLAFRISSRPTKMPKQFTAAKPISPIAGCHLVLGSSRGNAAQFQFLGSRNCMRSFCPNYPLLGMRNFSSNSTETSGKPLPWLTASMEANRRKAVKSETSKTGAVRSSWEESAEKFLKTSPAAVESSESPNFGSRRNEIRNRNSTRNEDGEYERDAEVVNDPKWYNIRQRYDNYVDVKPGSDRADVRRWSKQEDWGRKTWKEAKESPLPKMVGEGIYGVGPVLAAISACRREFYTLYVQEGLDLSSNNKKKKDKKGFERVLKIADKIGLTIKDVSKHDLNMISDNRPHQGLVLDASPLEMVGIKELEPVSVEGEKGPLWLALDEITDPQNLGAIIRSAYFFGASGVVLCAKNSAPLSGVVSKASAGSLELMELRSCKNMMQFLTSSAGNGWRVLGGSVSQRAVPLDKIAPGEPTILVLGSEGTGLRPLVERSCTELIRIPGNLPVDLVNTVDGDDDVDNIEISSQELKSFLAVESLNVSVAAGVLLNHLIGSNYDRSNNV